MYKPALLDKPQVLLINKMDTTSADRLLRECTQMLDNIPSESLRRRPFARNLPSAVCSLDPRDSQTNQSLY